MTKTQIIEGEEYVSREYCANFLNISKNRIGNIIKKQCFKTLKIGKRDWIKKIDLETFVNFRKEQKLLIKNLSEKRSFLKDKHKKEIKEFNIEREEKFNELKKKYCNYLNVSSFYSNPNIK
jgi:hypothetical protein